MFNGTDILRGEGVLRNLGDFATDVGYSALFVAVDEAPKRGLLSQWKAKKAERAARAEKAAEAREARTSARDAQKVATDSSGDE